jgi:glycosyltransferase involved in cell wall biosynthesis
MSGPRCTVAIPVFNQRGFIERAVQSALRQDAAPEVVVVDNASTDGTWEAVQKFAASGVKLHRNPGNLGLFGNFNRCLELAASPYLRLLSGDDALPLDCLGKEIDLMQRHADVVMLSTRGEFVEAGGAPMGTFANELPRGVYDGRRFADEWLQYYVHYRRNPLNYPSGVMLRRAAIGELRFDAALKTAGDIDFFLRLLERGNLAIDRRVGAYVTRHPSQAYVGPNMDGTAMRELLGLLERRAGGVRRLHNQFAGMCVAVGLQRWPRASSRESARIHLRLARNAASGWGAALAGLARLVGCRAAQALVGRHAPYVPRPLRALQPK